MKTTHLTYCSNIHPGESWADHFRELKQHVPRIKEAVSPADDFGLGLRLAAQAAEDLLKKESLQQFKNWLATEGLYVFTMNGFPFGDFHEHAVKDQVHAPDWTTDERLDYTVNLFTILAELLPNGLDGGVSTSPLSYRYWHQEGTPQWTAMRQKCTRNVLKLVKKLHEMELQTGKIMHLDIEPEPDGLLENGPEFLAWYENELLVDAIPYLAETLNCDPATAQTLVKRHVQLCYDVCHFALNYENHDQMIAKLNEKGIQIGKFQISSALQLSLAKTSIEERKEAEIQLQKFDEPIYLHQVIARTKDGAIKRFRDLDQALPHLYDADMAEWRSHFHVPIFLADYGAISSTQSDIVAVLAIQQRQKPTTHLEIETYTWGVLPQDLQMPIADSIIRELLWVKAELRTEFIEDNRAR